MTIAGLRKKYQPALGALDFDVLLAHALGQPKAFLYGHQEHSLSPTQRARFWRYARERRRGVPVAYITRHKEFCGLDFYVNKNTLIPRPETELLVEQATVAIRQAPLGAPLTLIDVGTGSGCIPVSVVQGVPGTRIQTLATDISKPALRVAKTNARRHGATIRFLHGDLLEPVWRIPGVRLNGAQLFITANLPYLTGDEIDNEPSIAHEPRLALFADTNGLALYEKMLGQLQKLLLAAHPAQVRLWCEINPGQVTVLRKIVKRFLPGASTVVYADLAGLQRVMAVTAH